MKGLVKIWRLNSEFHRQFRFPALRPALPVSCDDSKTHAITLAGLDDGSLPAEAIQRGFVLQLIPKSPVLIKPLDAAFAFQPPLGLIDQGVIGIRHVEFCVSESETTGARITKTVRCDFTKEICRTPSVGTCLRSDGRDGSRHGVLRKIPKGAVSTVLDAAHSIA